jgi:hypothetical protein
MFSYLVTIVETGSHLIFSQVVVHMTIYPHHLIWEYTYEMNNNCTLDDMITSVVNDYDLWAQLQGINAVVWAPSHGPTQMTEEQYMMFKLKFL